MSCRIPAVCVDTASGNNGDICTGPYIKIVIYKIVDSSVGYAGRNINNLLCRLRAYMYDKPGGILFSSMRILGVDRRPTHSPFSRILNAPRNSPAKSEIIFKSFSEIRFIIQTP